MSSSQAGLFDAPADAGALASDRAGFEAPEQWPVAPDWRGLVDGFWASPVGLGLADFLRTRQAAGATVYPPAPLRALQLTSLADVRVVILGQDPYHGPGQAEGLAFSVAPGVRLPPSLRNMFKELAREGVAAPVADGSLVRWATQGVLLINAVLTVEDGQPASHAGRGWEVLTDAIIEQCNTQGPAKVFMLWGAHAQKKASLIGPRHCVLMANHPLPLSANRPPAPFLGCGHFSRANAWLGEQGAQTIKW